MTPWSEIARTSACLSGVRCACFMRMQASQAMETDGDHKQSPAAGSATGVGLLPEIEAYAYLLTVMYLVDQKAYKEVAFCLI